MNLSTTYLGLTLKSPLVVGAAAPLTETLTHIRAMEDYGAGAIVLHSLFQEQIRQERFELHHHSEYGTDSFAEALTYFPEPEIFHVGVDEYLDRIQRAKEMVNVPIIASINGTSPGNWTDCARQIAQAGADAIELNIYAIPTELRRSGAEIEAEYVEILREVKGAVGVPVAVKLGPFFTNLSYMARQLEVAGADGLVLFNRFYQPDIDLDALEVKPHVLLSTPQDLRLPMRWIAILFGRIMVDFAATGGVQRGQDVVKLLAAGANAVMVVSALMRHGIEQLGVIRQELEVWLEEHEYESADLLRGSMSQRYCPNPGEFERVQYMEAIQGYQPQWALER